MLTDITGFFGKTVLNFWDIICWIVRAWFGLIDAALGLVGWLLVIASTYFLFESQWSIGAIVFLAALAFLSLRELFRLASFWLSEQKYAVSPEAFVGDIAGSFIGFIVIFGILLGTWYFFYPEQWLFVVSVELALILIIKSFSRFAKNFLATMKSKMARLK